MIAIIDYDAGNIRSVEKAFQFLGEETILTREQGCNLRCRQSCTSGRRLIW